MRVAIIENGEVVNVVVAQDTDTVLDEMRASGLEVVEAKRGEIERGYKRNAQGKFEPPQKPETPEGLPADPPV